MSIPRFNLKKIFGNISQRGAQIRKKRKEALLALYISNKFRGQNQKPKIPKQDWWKQDVSNAFSDVVSEYWDSHLYEQLRNDLGDEIHRKQKRSSTEFYNEFMENHLSFDSPHSTPEDLNPDRIYNNLKDNYGWQELYDVHPSQQKMYELTGMTKRGGEHSWSVPYDDYVHPNALVAYDDSSISALVSVPEYEVGEYVGQLYDYDFSADILEHLWIQHLNKIVEDMVASGTNSADIFTDWYENYPEHYGQFVDGQYR